MKISAETRTSQTRWTANSMRPSTDGFVLALKSKSGNHSDQTRGQKPAKENEEVARSAAAPDAIALVIPPQSFAEAKPAHISSVPVPSSVTNIERLSAEITQEIRVHNSDRAKRIDIEFGSKILEGLRVSIVGSNKAISVAFSTQSEAVAALLSQHSPELIDRLKHDGFTIRRIGVVKMSTAHATRNDRRKHDGSTRTD